MSLYSMIAGRNDALIISFSVILNRRIDKEIHLADLFNEETSLLKGMI